MNLFAICYYAPPQLTPQAIQIGRQLYHLDANVILLHGRDTHFAGAYDQYPDFFARVAPLPVSDPGPALGGLWHRAALRLLPLYGACPDLFGPWRRRALGPALASIRAARPDLIASFGMPMTDHLLALDIKRRTGLPWLAHFSDPWAGNPFHQTSWLERRVNAAMERRVIEHADAILFTSRRTLEQVMASYRPAWQDKAAVLPHAWDMDHFEQPLAPPSPRAPDARKVVRHIGACYGARSPAPLFEALACIYARHRGALDNVRFEFVGHLSPAFLACPALQALPAGLVSLRGQLGYRASLQLARDSDALLVIDAPSATDSVFLPSKLVEYIGAARPVWGITPPGAAADLIAEWAGSCALSADPGDAGAIERMVLAGLASLRAEAPPAAAEVRQRFAAARVAPALKLYAGHAVARCAARATTAAFNANETALRR
ncbi:MAG: glycosyltransferase [Massilia sp.]|nr:glycosyltransferase [Massilia sp.]